MAMDTNTASRIIDMLNDFRIMITNMLIQRIQSLENDKNVLKLKLHATLQENQRAFQRNTALESQAEVYKDCLERAGRQRIELERQMGALRRRNRILIDALGQSDDEQVRLFLCSMLINWYVRVCVCVCVCVRVCAKSLMFYCLNIFHCLNIFYCLIIFQISFQIGEQSQD